MKLKKIKVFFLALLLGTMPAARADMSVLEKSLIGIALGSAAIVGAKISSVLIQYLMNCQKLRSAISDNGAPMDTPVSGQTNITPSDINMQAYVEGLGKAIIAAQEAAYENAYNDAKLSNPNGSPSEWDSAAQQARSSLDLDGTIGDYTSAYLTSNSSSISASEFHSYINSNYPATSTFNSDFVTQANRLNVDLAQIDAPSSYSAGQDNEAILKYSISQYKAGNLKASVEDIGNWLSGKSFTGNAAEYISEFMPVSQNDVESAGVTSNQLANLLDSYATAGETRTAAINDIQNFLNNGFDIPVSTPVRADTYASKLDFLMKITYGSKIGFDNLNDWLSGKSLTGYSYDNQYIEGFLPQSKALNTDDVITFVQNWVGTGEAGNVSVGMESLLNALGGAVGINGLTLPSGYTNNLDYLIKNGFTNLTQVKALRTYVQDAARGKTQGDLPANWDPVNLNPVPHGSTTQTAQEVYEQLVAEYQSSIRTAESKLSSVNMTQEEFDTLMNELAQEFEDAKAAADAEAEAQIQQEIDEDQVEGQDEGLTDPDA